MVSRIGLPADRRKLDHARRGFQVGNLYLNRKRNRRHGGAHPFGGFKHGGTDSKAGGSDYLLLLPRKQNRWQEASLAQLFDQSRGFLVIIDCAGMLSVIWTGQGRQLPRLRATGHQ